SPGASTPSPPETGSMRTTAGPLARCPGVAVAAAGAAPALAPGVPVAAQPAGTPASASTTAKHTPDPRSSFAAAPLPRDCDDIPALFLAGQRLTVRGLVLPWSREVQGLNRAGRRR